LQAIGVQLLEIKLGHNVAVIIARCVASNDEVLVIPMAAINWYYQNLDVLEDAIFVHNDWLD
jgi:hypothetical protein